MADYPDECFRGLSDKNSITQRGYMSSSAFQFKEYKREDREIDDGFIELSVNWNDDDGAITTLLSQKKPGTDNLQFKVGYCKLNRLQIEIMLKQYIRDKQFSYERKPFEEDVEKAIEANPYHGNLLLHCSVDNGMKKNIEHMLAGSVEPADIFIREELQGNGSHP